MTQHVRISPEWVVKNHKHLSKRRSEYRRNKAKIKRLVATLDRQSEQLRALESVDEIWDGVPVWFDTWVGYGDKTGMNIHVVQGNRNARVYPNARNKGETFGVNLSEYSYTGYHRDGPKSSGGLFLGADFTEEEAHALARRYITKGTYPKKVR